MVYFKKYDPKNPLNTGRGSRIPFGDLNNGWGVLATEDNYLIAELRHAISEQRGGVIEISAEEFVELKKNERLTPRRIWREAITRLQIKRMLAAIQGRAAAEHRLPPGLKDNYAENRVLARPMAVSDIRVAVCQRG